MCPQGAYNLGETHIADEIPSYLDRYHDKSQD